jgi:hypothetical protein
MTTEKTQLGRNEPCPCGSGKKYKRCCGKDAAPKLGAPLDMSKRMAQSGMAAPAGSDEGTAPGSNPFAGFDPSQMDPQWVAQFQQMMQRLPRGQLQKMQALMQRAMAGKDVAREAAELERMMPPELLNMARSSPMAAQMAQQAGVSIPAVESDGMSLEEARKLVEEAAGKGEISAEQAQELLANAPTESDAKSGRFSKLWKSITGKK